MVPVAVLALACGGGADAPPLRVDAYDLGDIALYLEFETDDQVVALIPGDPDSSIGDLVRVDLATGESSVVASDVDSVARIPGSVDWVASSPDHAVFRLAPDGTVTQLFTLPDLYSLAPDAAADTFAYSTFPYQDLFVRDLGDLPVGLMDGGETFDGYVYAMAEDGAAFLATDADDQDQLWLVDAATGEPADAGRLDDRTLVGVAPGSLRIGLVGADSVEVRRPDGSGWTQPIVGFEMEAALAPDGSAVVAVESCDRCDADFQLVRYDADGSEVLGRGPAESEVVAARAASPSGRRYARSTADGFEVLGD